MTAHAAVRKGRSSAITFRIAPEMTGLLMSADVCALKFKLEGRNRDAQLLAQLADCLILFIPALNMTLTLGAAQFKQRLIFRYDGAEHFNCITPADLVVVIGLRFEAQPRQSNRAGYVIHWAEVATAFADGAFAICRASQSGSDTRTAIDLLGRAQWVNSL